MTDDADANSDAASTPILLVDDDERFRERLARALSQRGVEVWTAADRDEAIAIAQSHTIERAIVDLRMPGAHGLKVLRELLELHPAALVVMLTGYFSIATTVEAIRLGARDYLVKPCDADRILSAFDREPGEGVQTDEQALQLETPSLARVEWEHIERVLRECGGNVSKAARVLGIHRRTLQYKLSKFPQAR
ncbi:MAG: response regulator [Deltaproteobacteria bacterium]|nr:response regulator [Deltaproteobacteria bacterium]MBK8240216.1 response regulator [Deltaproteobacteria bacterium]MBP7292233.1 response regulator [Nannocystaceae bacterium]